MSKQNEVTEEAAGGVFIYVGLDPLTEPFRASGLTNETGWIPTNEMMETTMPGVYAVGMFEKKAYDKSLQQSGTAVSLANKYLIFIETQKDQQPVK